jgi:UDP-N-acetylmuramoylalanine--D-glutamate ligase
MNPSDVHSKNVTVVGGARSGLAAARLLAEAGAAVFLTEHGEATDGLVEALDEAGVEHEFGGHTRRALEADLFVVSPGVPSSVPILRQARRHGLRVYAEIEAAFWFCEAPVVAITGTNGKTTTTSLAGHLFRKAFEGTEREVIVTGNIGYPFSDYVREAGPQDVVVIEVSSFQLDHIDTFRPQVSALLNVTPDHLDRYDNDFNEYAQSKFRIFENQHGDDTLVYNRDDDLVRGFVEKVADRRGLQALAFSTKQEVQHGAFVDSDGRIIFRIHGQEEPLMLADKRAPSLRGQHNLQNTLAAAISARIMEVRSESLRESLTTFEGVPHRLELVRTTAAAAATGRAGGDGQPAPVGNGASGNGASGVRWVNDSKATNVNAVWYALESFEEPLVLIAGGRDKGNDYSALKPLVREKVRAVIALGESADKVMRDLGALAPKSEKVSSMEEATRAAGRLAQRGDVVLLSPACSSFDMYENYEERGDTFRRLVLSL